MSTDIPTPNPRPAAIGKILATLPEPTPVPPMFPPLPGGVLTTGTRGAVSELIACAHLMRQGYHVFRCESPAAPFDLVAYKDGRAVRVEVKTMQGYRNDRGCPDFSPVRNLEWDLLIVVGDFEVVELPNDGDLALTRERFRAHFGWPPGQTRTRSGNRAESSVTGSAVPAEGSGQRCPSRIAHESGAVHRCDLRSGHDGMHEVRLTRFFAEGLPGGSGHPQPTTGRCTSNQPWICTPDDCPGCFNPHCWVDNANTCRNGCDVAPRTKPEATDGGSDV